jgi:hypothetical protein
MMVWGRWNDGVGTGVTVFYVIQNTRTATLNKNAGLNPAPIIPILRNIMLESTNHAINNTA